MPKQTHTPVIEPAYMASIPSMNIGQLAALIRRACRWAQLDAETDGRKPPGWSIYAFPYAEALATLTSMREMYYSDSATYLVAYLQSNLTNWRGDLARACKARLQQLYKEGEAMQESGEAFTKFNQREIA